MMNEEPDASAKNTPMTTGGTKYWNSGAIPLIAPDILGNIITEIADIGIAIDATGVVLSVLVNPNYDAFDKLDSLESKDIRTALTVESVSKFDERLATFLDNPANARPIELNHANTVTRWEFPVRYSFHTIGPDDTILMLGRDLRPIADMQQQLVKAQMSLERDYEAQREFETRFRVLMENTSDAIVLVAMQSGKVTDSNSRAAALLGRSRDMLIGSNFSDAFEKRKRGDLLDRLSAHALEDTDADFPALVQHTSGPVNLHPTAFRVAGERLILCRITPVEPGESGHDQLGENLKGLYQRGPDAIVFTNVEGVVLSANDGFLHLLGSVHEAGVKGTSLADFLQRGSVDLKVMTENASRAGKMRMYETKIAGAYGSPRSVAAAVTAFQAGSETVFAFVMREAAQSEPMQIGDPAGDGMQSVMELVGSATLKDIVAETTNVVEKMCIETAIELTMNNRVAAAEMLGLSRQSLYVKLRKFGILSRDTDS